MRRLLERRLRPKWGDMQGLVASAYPHLPHAAYLLLVIERPADVRRWLAGVVDRVTTALDSPKTRRDRRDPPGNVNVAFTYSGLDALCGGSSNFSDAFVEGMHGREHRSRLLGDVGENAPAQWRWGGTEEARVDILLMVFARTRAALDEALANVAPPPGAARAVDAQSAALFDGGDRHEHFGFRDGISQPILAGSTEAERYPESIHLTALGEFVLGYPDASGRALGRRNPTGRIDPLPSMPGFTTFGRNGSYLVVRQLVQHVERFRCAIIDATRRAGEFDPAAAQRLAEKMVGRAVDGTPLVPCASADDNEFRYADDPYGYGCPLGSHVRRANPRDSFDNTTFPFEPRNDHRILRRGRSYVRDGGSEPDGSEKGLLFLCLNADIERQFEFIQQNWIGNPSFLGLAAERDPLLAGGQDGRGLFTIPGRPAPAVVSGLPAFVTVVGGGYFFLPGLSALKWLASGS